MAGFSYPVHMIRKLTARVATLAVLLLAGTAPLAGGPSPEFTIDRYTIDGGGGHSAGGVFSLTGTIGQHDASPAPAHGGVYALSGGFWGSGMLDADVLFRGGFEGP